MPFTFVSYMRLDGQGPQPVDLGLGSVLAGAAGRFAQRDLLALYASDQGAWILDRTANQHADMPAVDACARSEVTSERSYVALKHS